MRLLFVLGIASCFLGISCGSKKPDEDAGLATDASDADDLGDDGSAGDDSTCAPLPTTCMAIMQWQTACAPTDTCAASLVSNCANYDTAYSDVALVAIQTCYSYIAQTCTSDAGVDAADDVGLGANLAACLQEQLSQASPSAVQQSVATAYCSQCDPDNATCTAAFLSNPAYALLGDTLTQQISDTCLSGEGGAAGATCASTFQSCASPIAAMLPTLDCPTAGGGN